MLDVTEGREGETESIKWPPNTKQESEHELCKRQQVAQWVDEC